MKRDSSYAGPDESLPNTCGHYYVVKALGYPKDMTIVGNSISLNTCAKNAFDRANSDRIAILRFLLCEVFRRVVVNFGSPDIEALKRSCGNKDTEA